MIGEIKAREHQGCAWNSYLSSFTFICRRISRISVDSRSLCLVILRTTPPNEQSRSSVSADIRTRVSLSRLATRTYAYLRYKYSVRKYGAADYAKRSSGRKELAEARDFYLASELSSLGEKLRIVELFRVSRACRFEFSRAIASRRTITANAVRSERQANGGALPMRR